MEARALSGTECNPKEARLSDARTKRWISHRSWARKTRSPPGRLFTAQGTYLLGVKAVIAESFERIHRSNLVGMGVLPLTFKDGDNAQALGLTGEETFDLTGFDGDISPRQDVAVAITYKDGRRKTIKVLCRIDTANEVEYYRHGGILHYVLRQLVA